MKQWYKVEIRGKVGWRPKVLQAHRQAEDAMWAAYEEVMGTWPDRDVEHDYMNLRPKPGPAGQSGPTAARRVIRFLMRDEADSMVFETEHESFEEMAAAITDAAAVARLEGAVELPPVFGEKKEPATFRHPAMAVACPTCGATVGHWCKRPSGHSGPMVAFHAARRKAVEGQGVGDG